MLKVPVSTKNTRHRSGARPRPQLQRGECFGLLVQWRGQDHHAAPVARINRANSGSIEIAGIAVPQHARRTHEIGVVPQLDNLDPIFSARKPARLWPLFGMTKVRSPRVPMLLILRDWQTSDAQLRSCPAHEARLTSPRAGAHPDILFLDEPHHRSRPAGAPSHLARFAAPARRR